VDYRLSQPQTGRKPDRRKKCVRLDVRLDIDVARRFEWALGVMGVTNKTNWVNKCVLRFIKAAERREKKIAACAGTQTTKQVVTPHNISTSV
jgi:hypothetical protein